MITTVSPEAAAATTADGFCFSSRIPTFDMFYIVALSDRRLNTVIGVGSSPSGTPPAASGTSISPSRRGTASTSIPSGSTSKAKNGPATNLANNAPAANTGENNETRRVSATRATVDDPIARYAVY